MDMEEKVIPRLRDMIQGWRSTVLTIWGVLIFALGGALFFLGISWEMINTFIQRISENSWLLWISTGLFALGFGWIHFQIRNFSAWWIKNRIYHTLRDEELLDNYLAAFANNIRWTRSIFWNEPSGWNYPARTKLNQLIANSSGYIQKLNDAFTNPSGHIKEDSPPTVDN